MLRIHNPFYKSSDDLVVEDLMPKIIAALTANAQSMGPLVTIAEVRNALLPVDAAKLNRKIFNQVCKKAGLLIDDPTDSIG